MWLSPAELTRWRTVLAFPPSRKWAGGFYAVEMQRSEDFRRREHAGKGLRFSQTQRFSQKQSDKNRTIKLVVVMSAVDWWKCTRMHGLACDFAIGVSRISVRSCGKRRLQRSIE